MSYENVVGGKLKLKGKALNVQSGGMKKKRKDKSHLKQLPVITNEEAYAAAADGADAETALQPKGTVGEPEGEDSVHGAIVEDHRTAAEKRYHEQKLKLEAKRLAKVASKSHRERIEEFNQYLANLSEHYDIPKVGPG
ncbi:hypothetical protein GOP47_0005555 [Adiantum capillus-veneris]|uniref:DUF1754-domain-containing protein n=1 Tax=Adiantum capillus-veneris TaxID=13818 RepID=A0A9D4V690_ADICA|nr:hypothetical protein GOP47_0005555 [Adiantum capillus-veneris]